MKKGLIFLLVMVILAGLMGCTQKEEPEEITKNEVFAGMFDEATQMTLLGIAGPISGAQMDEVVQILETVSLSPVAEGITTEESDAYLLIVSYSDGASRTLYVSDGMIAFNEVDGARYFVADGTAFLTAFLQAFGVAG